MRRRLGVLAGATNPFQTSGCALPAPAPNRLFVGAIRECPRRKGVTSRGQSGDAVGGVDGLRARPHLRLSRSISLRSSWAPAFASGYARSPHPPGRVIRRRAAPTSTLCPDMRMREASLRRRLQGSCPLQERHVRRMISRPAMAPGAPALRPRRVRSPRRQKRKVRACFAAALLLGRITSHDA